MARTDLEIPVEHDVFDDVCNDLSDLATDLDRLPAYLRARVKELVRDIDERRLYQRQWVAVRYDSGRIVIDVLPRLHALIAALRAVRRANP